MYSRSLFYKIPNSYPPLIAIHSVLVLVPAPRNSLSLTVSNSNSNSGNPFSPALQLPLRWLYARVRLFFFLVSFAATARVVFAFAPLMQNPTACRDNGRGSAAGPFIPHLIP